MVREFYRLWDADGRVPRDFAFHVGGIPHAFNLDDIRKINQAFWDSFE